MTILFMALGGTLAATLPCGRLPLSVSVLTYNTHLLPRISEAFASHRERGDYRAQAIGREIAAYELVGLCEVFDSRYRQTLIKSAQAASGEKFHALWTKKPRGVGFANSGLLLLSRFVIEETNTITYAAASGFATHGFRADGFAAKGAIHARLRLGERPAAMLDCFLTHLESRSDEARASQLSQLAAFMRQHCSALRPALLMGDLNVAADPSAARVDGSPYDQLTACLGRSGVTLKDTWLMAGRGAAGTSDPLAADGGDRIDYIWLSGAHAVARDVEVLRFLDPGVSEGSLSDHAAVATHLNLFRRDAHQQR